MNIENKVKELLLKEWDPIGIKDNPNAKGEYDSYALRIVGMLRNGKTEAEIFNFLKDIIVKELELLVNEKELHSVAKKIMESAKNE